MASLIFTSTPLSHLSSSPSTSFSSCHLSVPHRLSRRLNPIDATLQRLSSQKRVSKSNSNRSIILAPPSCAAEDVSAVVDDVSAVVTGTKSIASLKLKLLSTISGLNRGLAAKEDDLRQADDAAKNLEAAGGPVDLPTDLEKLQGRWKLIYSSAFSSRTLGGSRPGPPTGRLLPITLGQVFQRIDIVRKDFDNIVDLELGAPWPLPPIEVTATLAHQFELIGKSKMKINFEKTTVKARGNLSQLPELDIPQIPDQFRPPSNTGRGEFEVTYIDSDTRITRGDKEELRVFVIC